MAVFQAMTLSQNNLDWLLDNDPALRWQVERDLANLLESVWNTTRMRVPHEGFGARLLALQDLDGQWAGGSYFPRRADQRIQPHLDDKDGQPYTATTWTLNALREWGVESSFLPDTAEKLAKNSKWDYDDLPYWGGEVDCCINAFTLANGVWLGADVRGLRDWFLEHQMQDGGWNCEWIEGSKRSSFHSTLNSIRGILWYEREIGGDAELKLARHRAHEYLLDRRLTLCATTRELVGGWVTDFSYPFRWKYSALRALDYFREAGLFDGLSPDQRASEAIALVRSGDRGDGRWLQQGRYPGATWFDIDVEAGEPSPWLTFYATRVLNWWES